MLHCGRESGPTNMSRLLPGTASHIVCVCELVLVKWMPMSLSSGLAACMLHGRKTEENTRSSRATQFHFLQGQTSKTHHPGTCRLPTAPTSFCVSWAGPAVKVRKSVSAWHKRSRVDRDGGVRSRNGRQCTASTVQKGTTLQKAAYECLSRGHGGVLRHTAQL